MRRPTDSQFAEAINWLDLNEGPDGEREACCAVIAWIEENMKSNAISRLAREAGCTRRYARLLIEKKI